MLKPSYALTLGLLALAAAAGLATSADAGPCAPDARNDSNNNTCLGSGALGRNADGAYNSASGSIALYSNTSGSFNTASGASALHSNKAGLYNSATGFAALFYNDSGSSNTALGASALFANTTGNDNSASGVYALSSNLAGNRNLASGAYALYANVNGSDNAASGHRAGGKQTGSRNTSLGAEAGWRGELSDGAVIAGSDNIAVGYRAGSQLGAGSNNIVIGNPGGSADANTIRIGSAQTAAFIAGVYNTRVARARTVLINANGQLGTSKSSIRYKEDVHAMGDASSPVMNLRPVTFRYKEAESDGSKPVQYGLIAEEVEKVMPDLVIYNEQGTPESVAYETLPSLLLNEYQKQARELAAAKAELAETKARFESEIAALKLAVGRLAAAPSSVKVAATAP